MKPSVNISVAGRLEVKSEICQIQKNKILIWIQMAAGFHDSVWRISMDLTSCSNIICWNVHRHCPSFSSDSRLYHWVDNYGWSGPNLPGLICKFSIKARVQAGQRQPEWITKINSRPLMMRLGGKAVTPGRRRRKWGRRWDTGGSNHSLMKNTQTHLTHVNNLIKSSLWVEGWSFKCTVDQQ